MALFKHEIICRQCGKLVDTYPAILKQKPTYVTCEDCQRTNKVNLARLLSNLIEAVKGN